MTAVLQAPLILGFRSLVVEAPLILVSRSLVVEAPLILVSRSLVAEAPLILGSRSLVVEAVRGIVLAATPNDDITYSRRVLPRVIRIQGFRRELRKGSKLLTM